MTLQLNTRTGPKAELEGRAGDIDINHIDCRKYKRQVKSRGFSPQSYSHGVILHMGGRTSGAPRSSEVPLGGRKSIILTAERQVIVLV